jgi:hypothetical protein
MMNPIVIILLIFVGSIVMALIFRINPVKVIIITWAIIVFLMCLAPPWLETTKIPPSRDLITGIQTTQPRGYHLIFCPPPERFALFSVVKIDGQRLFIQIIGVTVLAGAILFLTKKRNMNWDEEEKLKPGQMCLPGLKSPLPTVAERAFLALGRKWQAEVEKAPSYSALSRNADVLALSCLLLAVEWGRKFTDVARRYMEANQLAAGKRCEVSWMDKLPWKLCIAANCMAPPRADAVQELTVNLDHHNSTLRIWCMEMGWVCRQWLDKTKVMPLLLKNVAASLRGIHHAMGLAYALCDTDEEFEGFIKTFELPADLADFNGQFRERIKTFRDEGFYMFQSGLWDMEAQCRQLIEKEALGLRLSLKTTENG